MLTLRPTTADDLPGVAALESMTDTATWLGETGLAWHEKAMRDPDQQHLVSANGAALTGFVVLAGLNSGAIELRRMAVHPEFRGVGRGRALLQAALAYAYDSHQASRVWLDVKTHNLRAKRLYESAGFRATETRTGVLTEPDGTSTDLLIMVHQQAAR